MIAPTPLELTCSYGLAGVHRNILRFAYGKSGWKACQPASSLAAFLDHSRRRAGALVNFLNAIGLVNWKNGQLIWQDVSTFNLTIEFEP